MDELSVRYFWDAKNFFHMRCVEDGCCGTVWNEQKMGRRGKVPVMILDIRTTVDEGRERRSRATRGSGGTMQGRQKTGERGGG